MVHRIQALVHRIQAILQSRFHQRMKFAKTKMAAPVAMETAEVGGAWLLSGVFAGGSNGHSPGSDGVGVDALGGAVGQTAHEFTMLRKLPLDFLMYLIVLS